MADNRLNLTLTATDKATATINKVNKTVSKLFRPFDEVKRSTLSAYKAMGNNDLLRRPLWALDKVGKGMTMFGTSFGVAEDSVLGGSARIASALGAMGGPLGGLLAGAAAVAGGTMAVSVKMAQLGQSIKRTSQNLNMNTDDLQRYQGAAKLAGLQTEQMDGALASLGANLFNEQAGLNQPLSAALQYAQVNIKKTKDGAVDTKEALLDIADVVKGMPDQVAARQFTDMLGVSELLPLLRRGREGIQEFLREAEKLGIQSQKQLDRNDEQAQSWNRTKTALDAAATSVGNLVAKYFDLDAAAAATTATAEKLQKGGSPLRVIAENIWNHSPNAWLLRKAFGEMRSEGADLTAPTARRSASGKITEAAGAGRGSINPPSALTAVNATASRLLGGAPAGSAPSTGGNSPMGLRNNNPGNLRSWPGAGSAGGFATFSTPEAGLTAMGKNLIAYQNKYGISTISGIVNRWAPASDGNNVGSYVADVSKQTGFGVDQPLNLHDPKTLAPLISAITRHENGQNPYDAATIARAVADAVREGMASSGTGQGQNDSESSMARAVGAAVREGIAASGPVRIEITGTQPGQQVKILRGLAQPTTGALMRPGGAS